MPPYEPAKQGFARSASALYQWACERLYHEFAWAYDGVAAAVSLGRWDRWRSSVLAHVRGPAVLELGLGTGTLLPQLTAHYDCAVGIELSAAMLDVARRKWREERSCPWAVRASALSLPLATGSLDTVVATFPAPYIFDRATLQEVRRVLRPGGRLVVAGLWVDWADGRANGFRRPALYGRPSPAHLIRIGTVVTAAGLVPAIFAQSVAGAAVGTLVACKERGDHEPSHG